MPDQQFDVALTYQAAGQAYSYAAGPIDRAQQISTMATAANTAVLGFQFAGAFQAQGVGFEDAAKFIPAPLMHRLQSPKETTQSDRIRFASRIARRGAQPG